VNGGKFTSKKIGYTDKYVFFPAADRCYNGKRDRIGGYGFVWSSTLNSSNVINGKDLYFYNGSKYVRNEERSLGCNVRAIYDGPTLTIITPILGALYIDKSTNVIYRYDGSAYV
jgi:hypothetical protein